MIRILTCKRCGHVWVSRLKEGKPQTCAKCRSRIWEKPRNNHG